STAPPGSRVWPLRHSLAGGGSDVIRVSTLGRLLLAGGVSGAAVIGLITHAFVRNWEPVPAGLPLFGSAVWVSGLVLLACGACLLVPRAAPSAAVALKPRLRSRIEG